jgi:hypothetical protein
MKPVSGYPYIPVAIVVLVAVFVLFAGCTSESDKIPGNQTASQATAIGGTGSTSLPYGVSIAVPATWTREDLLTSRENDYGTTTVTIARFTSPVTIPGDAASRNTLTVDFDQSPGGDFEVYFNQATLALEKTYDTASPPGIVKSSTLDISGYKSYEVDFQSSEVKGSYIFTSTEKGMYIFAFKGPNQPVPVHSFEREIVDIYKSIKITPSDK